VTPAGRPRSARRHLPWLLLASAVLVAAVWLALRDAGRSSSTILLAPGCPWPDCPAAEREEGHARRLVAVKLALTRARAWYLAQDEIGHGEILMMRHMLCARPDEVLAAHIEVHRRRQLGDRDRAKLLDPSLPGYPLTGDMRKPQEGVYHFIVASFGDPEDLALDLLRQYLQQTHDGYELTHQLLAATWWEDVGRVLPDDLRNLRPPILERIRREHAAEEGILDLYAERAAVLTLFDERPCPPSLPKWVDVMLEAHQEDGGWPVDRGLVPPAQSTGHTSVFGFVLLQAYRDCMEPHPETLVAFTPWRGFCGKGGPWLGP
jgi:hypothetical protein